jgi:hypothetical protein
VQRRRQVAALALQHVGDLREALVERPHRVVVARQRVHEALELPHRPEQVVLVVGQGPAQPAEALDGPVELRALPTEVGRGGVEQVGQRALLVGAVRAQGRGQVVEAGVDLVELQGYGGAVLVEGGPVGEHPAPGVRRGQLHEPVAHDRRRDDDRLRVRRDLHVRVVVHPHHDLGAGGGHRVDLADGHTEHPHVAALVERDRPREVGGQGLLVAAVEHERDQRRDHEGEQHQWHREPGEQPHLNHPPAGPAACSGCRCRTTARRRACSRTPGRTGRAAGCSGRCCRRSCSARRGRRSGGSGPA